MCHNTPPLTQKIECDNNPIPKRKFVLELELQADSKQALIQALKGIALDLCIDERDSIGLITNGAPDAGYNLTLKCNENQTHEGYFKDIESWRIKKKIE